VEPAREMLLASSLWSGRLTPVWACLSYALSSVMMTFSNKIILSTYQFSFPIWLTLYQSAFTFVILYGVKFFELFTIAPLSQDKILKWAPLSVLFVLTLVTAQYSLGLLSVPMVVIFKQFTTIAITIGDWYFHGNHMSAGIVASVVIMFIGSVVAGFNDLEYNFTGYMWMAANCTFQAGYSLYQKTALDKTEFNEWSASYYNNFLCIPAMLIVFVFFPNEFWNVHKATAFEEPEFVYLLIMNGLCGIFISLSIFWVIGKTSPATFSVVGSLTKIPLTVLASYIFHTPFTPLGKLSCFVSLSGGVIFSITKARLQSQ